MHVCACHSPSRLEVVQIMQQKAIHGFMTAYSFSIVAQVLVFLIYVPSVLSRGEQPLSAYFIVLSLVQFLRVNAIVIVLRSLVAGFDAHTSVQRIQVLIPPPPPPPPPLSSLPLFSSFPCVLVVSAQ